MSQPDCATDWGKIDHAGDPKYFVRYLDQLSALDGIQQSKRQSFAMLEPRERVRLLDIGCGNGDDVRALAELVGASGRVVGIDNSATMIAEANKRSAGKDLPVEFSVGDIYHLDFPDNSFDGCRADRVFQHLQEPRSALAEMIRVAKPSAPIVVTDPDWETLIVDAPDRDLTRKILNVGTDSRVNGWSGRQLIGLFKSFGLKDIALVPVTLTLTDYTVALQAAALEQTVQRTQEAGIISADQGRDWLVDLKQRAAAGVFFLAMTAFVVSGRK